MWLWIAAAAAAFYIKGLCGFANTLVFTSILGFGASNVNISPVELLLGYPTNIILVWKNRKKLKTGIWLPLAALVLAGCIPGAILLRNADVRLLKILFGAVVILTGLQMLLGQKESRGGSKLVMGIIGLLSGLLCGLFGVGALLAAYVSRTTDSGDAFKANISAVFIAENTFRIILYSVMGVITLSAVKRVLVLLPFMLLGLFAGMKSSSKLDERIVRRLVIVLLILSGAALIAMNV